MRPGVNVLVRETAPPIAFPTETGPGLMAGVVERGPLVPVSVTNMTDFEKVYGQRTAITATYYDSAKAFFDEGGYKLYVGRVVGPSAVTASVMLVDGAAANTLQAQAKGPGEYGNDLTVVVRTNAEDSAIPVGSFRLRVQNDAGTTIYEESPDLLDDSAAILWAQTASDYINLVDQASTNDPAAGSYPLTGGLLDQGNITDAEWATALARFDAEFGPGQVFAPGRTTDTGHDQIADHCETSTMRRVAILDAPDTAAVATLTASAAGRRTRFGGLFGPWLHTPGLTVGTTRLIPPSGAVAGLIGRNDGLGMSPNEPAAGNNGIFRSVLNVTQKYTDAERETLNNGGVNIIRNMFGRNVVYGWRTTVSATSDPNWINFGNARLHMAISALANAVGERFIFRQIDGERKLIGEFGGALTGEVLLPFFEAGSLFGQTPDEAFAVDVGPTVNTEETIANNELNAVITVKMSPFGEKITIEIVKKLLTEEF